jgi:hypothetical protein
MSDVTSGANIFDNISLDRACSELCGLTESEVEKALKTIIKECGLADSFVKGALALMQTYYQGYYFHQRQVEKIFNPTLCLYFFKKFKRECEYPEEMLDANLAPDADNLRYIKGLPGGEKLLWELSQGKRITTTKLINKFGLKDMFNQKRMDLTFLTSFLWYSGIISIAGKNKKGSLIFDVPNLVIHGLFIDEAKDILLTDSLARNDALNASAKLYEDGEIEPVVKFVEQRIYPVFSNRDYIRADELSVKAIFLAILFEDRFFIMESERERRKGYPDLAMIVRPDCRQNGILDVIIEFKYISLSEMKITGEQIRKMTDHALCATDKVKEKLEQGKKQAVRYAQDLKNEIQFVSDDFAPAKWVVVSVGFERIVWKKV